MEPMRVVAGRDKTKCCLTRGTPHLVTAVACPVPALLESGVIPHRKIGTRCRVLFEHLMAYKKAEDAKRMEALNGLTRQAQELGLGY
jgi:hypothetical protein